MEIRKSMAGLRPFLSRGGRPMLLGETAASPRALPGFDLLGIYFRQIEDGAALRAGVSRRSGIVELAVDPIRIPVGFAKDPRTIAPYAGVIGADRLRIFLDHDTLHGRVM